MDTRVRWLLVVVVVVGVVGGSLARPSAAPAFVWEAPGWLRHAGAYFVVALLAFYATEERWHPTVAVGVIALGAGVELAQAFVPYRTASLVDVAANAAGVFAAVAVVWCARYARSVRKV